MPRSSGATRDKYWTIHSHARKEEMEKKKERLLDPSPVEEPVERALFHGKHSDRLSRCQPNWRREGTGGWTSSYSFFVILTIALGSSPGLAGSCCGRRPGSSCAILMKRSAVLSLSGVTSAESGGVMWE